jgi:hypothetical protein
MNEEDSPKRNEKERERERERERETKESDNNPQGAKKMKLRGVFENKSE